MYLRSSVLFLSFSAPCLSLTPRFGIDEDLHHILTAVGDVSGDAEARYSVVLPVSPDEINLKCASLSISTVEL